MPYMCCVAKCPNSTLHPGRTNFSFHRFPKDEALSDQWMANINRPHFSATKHTRICSAHFEDWCFQRNDENDVRNSGLPVLRRSLKTVAVPTLFNKMILTRVLHKGGKKAAKKKAAQVANGDQLPPAEPYEVSVSLNNCHPNQQPTIEQDGTTINSHGHHHNGQQPPPPGDPYTGPGSTSPARPSDTYELTELTPMVKRERLSPLPETFADHLQFHRALAEVDDGNRLPITTTTTNNSLAPIGSIMVGGDANGPWGRGSLAPPQPPSCYDGVNGSVTSCIISETFLFTMLRLIKCPHCGYGANPEQMHKYENQGCLLGVRLACYNGHLVLDWMI